MAIVPPAGRSLLARAPAPDEAAIHALAAESGPERNLRRFPVPTAIGGEFVYRLDPEWLESSPSHLATERTYVEFQGRTAFGDRSEFPFYARSADWQESDRLMAGIITAFGSPTGVINVGGHGEFRGTMTKSFKSPLIEGEFVGARHARVGRGVGARGRAVCRSRTATWTSRRRWSRAGRRRSRSTAGSRSATRAGTAARRSTPGSC